MARLEKKGESDTTQDLERLAVATTGRVLLAMKKNLDYIKCAKRSLTWFCPGTMILSKFHLNASWPCYGNIENVQNRNQRDG